MRFPALHEVRNITPTVTTPSMQLTCLSIKGSYSMAIGTNNIALCKLIQNILCALAISLTEHKPLLSTNVIQVHYIVRVTFPTIHARYRLGIPD